MTYAFTPINRDKQRSLPEEMVEVTYYPVHKNQGLGKRMTRTIRAKRGEHPLNAAERALRKSYKVKDFLILEAQLMSTGFWAERADA